MKKGIITCIILLALAITLDVKGYTSSGTDAIIKSIKDGALPIEKVSFGDEVKDTEFCLYYGKAYPGAYFTYGNGKYPLVGELCRELIKKGNLKLEGLDVNANGILFVNKQAGEASMTLNFDNKNNSSTKYTILTTYIPETPVETQPEDTSYVTDFAYSSTSRVITITNKENIYYGGPVDISISYIMNKSNTDASGNYVTTPETVVKKISGTAFQLLQYNGLSSEGIDIDCYGNLFVTNKNKVSITFNNNIDTPISDSATVISIIQATTTTTTTVVNDTKRTEEANKLLSDISKINGVTSVTIESSSSLVKNEKLILKINVKYSGGSLQIDLNSKDEYDVLNELGYIKEWKGINFSNGEMYISGDNVICEISVGGKTAKLDIITKYTKDINDKINKFRNMTEVKTLSYSVKTKPGSTGGSVEFTFKVNETEVIIDSEEFYKALRSESIISEITNLGFLNGKLVNKEGKANKGSVTLGGVTAYLYFNPGYTDDTNKLISDLMNAKDIESIAWLDSTSFSSLKKDQKFDLTILINHNAKGTAADKFAISTEQKFNALKGEDFLTEVKGFSWNESSKKFIRNNGNLSGTLKINGYTTRMASVTKYKDPENKLINELFGTSVSTISWNTPSVKEGVISNFTFKINNKEYNIYKLFYDALIEQEILTTTGISVVSDKFKIGKDNTLTATLKLGGKTATLYHKVGSANNEEINKIINTEEVLWTNTSPTKGENVTLSLKADKVYQLDKELYDELVAAGMLKPIEGAKWNAEGTSLVATSDVMKTELKIADKTIELNTAVADEIKETPKNESQNNGGGSQTGSVSGTGNNNTYNTGVTESTLTATDLMTEVEAEKKLEANDANGLIAKIVQLLKPIIAIVMFASIVLVGMEIILKRNKTDERIASMTSLMWIGIGGIIFATAGTIFIFYARFALMI